MKFIVDKIEVDDKCPFCDLNRELGFLRWECKIDGRHRDCKGFKQCEYLIELKKVIKHD